MKILNIVLKVLLCLLIVSPIFGALNIGPAPTPDLYNTPQAYQFIKLLLDTRYVIVIEAVVFALAIGLIIAKRTALAALLILPVSVCIIGFHLILDGGLFTPGAIMANLLILINTYFLWQNRHRYANLLEKDAAK